MARVTHKQALDAFCDPEVPLEDAYELFERAHRRSNEATKAFTVGVAMNLRAHAMKQAEISIIAPDGDGGG